MHRSAALILLCASGLMAQSGGKTIEVKKVANAPGWALAERRLLDEMSRAALEFVQRYTRSGGTLIWKTKGSASFDDPYESFYNYPLLYALGGDAHLKDLSFTLWNAMTRQLDSDFRALHKEYAPHGDWFHHGEGNLFFYFLGLADPTDHEFAVRARRFSGFYLNEDPEALNYDPALKMIRSPRNGSRGPQFGSAAQARPFVMARGMAVYGLPLEDVPGVRTAADLADPENAKRFGIAMQERMYRGGDVPPNLAATSLAAHAYLITGEKKYEDWVKDYVGAWVERTRANGGIVPDNVGLSGKVGEYFNGKWWGGLYGWRWPHGYHSVGQAIHIGAANAMLLSGGDAKYLEMPRTTLETLIAAGKLENGAFLIPEQKSADGWFAYKQADRSYLASLWFMSQDSADWQRIESVRQRDQADWNRVVDMHNKMDSGHDAPWLRFLAGANPGYPERILTSARGQVALRLQRMRDNWLLIDEYPGTWRQVDPAKTDLTLLNEHHWQGQNPVTTEALVQIMLGAPQIQYNGGLLFASVRYFDPQRRRPGAPPDVAAMVRTIERNRLVLELYNLSAFERREVIVQAGMFGEHQFTAVKAAEGGTVDVDGKYFTVGLEPGAGTTIEMGLQRWANRPSYAFPWHGERVPVQ